MEAAVSKVNTTELTDGQTITLLKAGEEATVNRTVKFTVDPNPDKDYTIVLGKSCTDKDAAEHVFDIVYSQPSNPVSYTHLTLLPEREKWKIFQALL